MKKTLGLLLLLFAILSTGVSPALAQAPNNMDSSLVKAGTSYSINPNSSISVESTLVLRSLDKEGELRIPLLPYAYYNNEYYLFEYDEDSVNAQVEGQPVSAEIVVDHLPYLALDQTEIADNAPVTISYSFSNALIDNGSGGAYLALDMAYPWGMSDEGVEVRLIAPPQPFTPTCSGNCSMINDGADVVFTIPGGQGSIIGLLWPPSSFLVPNAEHTPGYSPGVEVEGMNPFLFGLLILAAGTLSMFMTFKIVKAVIRTDQDKGLLSLRDKQFRSRIK